MTMLFAGSGVKPGVVGNGRTWPLLQNAFTLSRRARNDVHLLGLDDNKLTYLHAGRHKQLSQFGGEVIQDLIS